MLRGYVIFLEMSFTDDLASSYRSEAASAASSDLSENQPPMDCQKIKIFFD